MVCELESDLQDPVDWEKKWLVDFNARKTQLVSFDHSNSNGSIDVKMDGSVLRGPSLLNWIGVLTLSLLLKLPPRKLELLFIL